MKPTMSNPRKHRALLIATIGVIFGFAVFSWINRPRYDPCDGQEIAFDQTAWIGSRESRGCMVMSLFPGRHWDSGDNLMTPESPLYALNKDHVVDLLGPPDSENNGVLVYRLGGSRYPFYAVGHGMFKLVLTFTPAAHNVLWAEVTHTY